MSAGLTIFLLITVLKYNVLAAQKRGYLCTNVKSEGNEGRPYLNKRNCFGTFTFSPLAAH